MSTTMEPGRQCPICEETKAKYGGFTHGICNECHACDTSQCELCHPRGVK